MSYTSMFNSREMNLTRFHVFTSIPHSKCSNFNSHRENIHERDVKLELVREELRLDITRLEERFEHETPLMAAAKSGNIEIVRYLLSLGANLEAENLVHWLSFSFPLK